MSPDEDGMPTADGGRRRAIGADVPESLRKELIAELASDGRRARDAGVALGDRGGSGTPEGRRERLAAAMRALLRHRRPEATICPSDAARVVGGESWRDLMDTAREVAAELAAKRVITVRQRGADVDIATVTGPIRLARGPRF